MQGATDQDPWTERTESPVHLCQAQTRGKQVQDGIVRQWSEQPGSLHRLGKLGCVLTAVPISCPTLPLPNEGDKCPQGDFRRML